MAKVVRTRTGKYKVVHSITGVPTKLPTFSSKKMAMSEARKLAKRIRAKNR